MIHGFFLKVVGDKPIEYSDRTKLPYVDATIMEIQRLGNICELLTCMSVMFKTYDNVSKRACKDYFSLVLYISSIDIDIKLE